jgi:hypothetical protein
MQEELPKKKKQSRTEGREKEMRSKTYNVAQLFDDCLIVGCKLAEAANEEFSE